MKSGAMPAPGIRLKEKPATDEKGLVGLEIIFAIAVQLERWYSYSYICASDESSSSATIVKRAACCREQGSSLVEVVDVPASGTYQCV
jgi:hypothetical protein